MFNKRAYFLLALGCLAASAWAADDPMVGDWKLNPQKSRIIDEMKVTSLGGNKYAFDFVGGPPENIVVDGTDQPGMAGTTLAVAATPDSWTVVRKEDGKVELKATWTLSKDGATLQDDYTEFGDGGKTMHVVYRYDRKAGGPGFAGDWLSTTQQMDTPYVIQVRPYENDGLSITAEGSTRNLKFDGKEYPADSKVRSTSAQRVNERTIALTDKRQGKLADSREVSVSEDGKTLTMTIHVPARSEPDVLVFDKQ
jgi:hypothetical protein